MGWFKTIQAKIIGYFFPISITNLQKEGWSKVRDTTGPFGEFLSYKKWQCNLDGVTGHRFILYPKNHDWNDPKDWTLIDFSKDTTCSIFYLKQLKSSIPTPYI
jgi:hypothetical protein